MAVRMDSVARAGTVLVVALGAQLALALRGNLEVDGPASVPQAARSISKRLAGALGAPAGRIGGAFAASAPPPTATASDRLSPGAKGGEPGASGVYKLKNWNRQEFAARDAKEEHEDLFSRRDWAREFRRRHVDIADLGARSAARIASVAPYSVLGSQGRSFSTVTTGAGLEPVATEPQVERAQDPWDIDLMDGFVSTLERDLSVASTWRMWNEFRLKDMPMELQKSVSTQAVEGAFAIAVQSDPETAELASNVIHSMILEFHNPSFTPNLAHWFGRLDVVKEALLRWIGSSDEDDAVHFGRWIRARMLLEVVVTALEDTDLKQVEIATHVQGLRRNFDFAASHHANSAEVLQALEELRAEVMSEKQEGQTRMMLPWLDKSIEWLGHLSDSETRAHGS